MQRLLREAGRVTSETTTSRLHQLLHSTLVRGITLLAVFAIGFGVHWLMSGVDEQPDRTADSQTDSKPDDVDFWTCSMHPQVHLPEPGTCPLCPMDLIPVRKGAGEMTGMRQLVVSPEARALMNVQVQPVQRRSVTATVRMVGKVDYDETRLSYITAWVPGRLDRLYVDYTGIEVREGDHMVYIYSPDLYAAQQELIEALRSRREREEPSRFGAGIDFVESARAKLRLLGMTPEQIAEIEERDSPSDHMTIYAPMSGVVIEKNKQEGDYVQTGDRIYSMADLSQVWVKMDAYESDLDWVRYGQEVEFTTEAYPGETFVGRIAFVDPYLNERTRTKKVRVNVPNTDGKLSPEMLVHGEVRAEIAEGGRVIDPDLAGKWISPMHPEIVKDEPGVCDICGMPLVRAETLGYTTPRLGHENLPLVIPVSAALVTGTRAVVYVEDPTTEQPTFHGREIVLGPRAGDYYLVESGLEEGELVVTRGNFKIDSALQIRAQPSMMTPQGGGGGGGHHHGGATEHAPSETTTEQEVEVPPAVTRQLAALQHAFHEVQTAVAAGDLPATRATFVAFGEVLRTVEPDAFQGHARMLWSELFMLMTNDVVEGRAVITQEDAERVLRSLTETMQRLDTQFGVSHAGHLARTFDVPAEFQQQLAGLWAGYVQLSAALAGDDAGAARQTLPGLTQALAAVDMKLLADAEAHEAWMREQSNLQSILKTLADAEDLRQLRAAFEALSGEMQALVLQFGLGGQHPVYELHCPMAFGNKGAIWLQPDDQARNPYFGAEMPKCADRIDQIAGAADNSPDSEPSQQQHD